MKFGLWDSKTTKKTMVMKNVENFGLVAPLLAHGSSPKIGVIFAPWQPLTGRGGGPMAFSVSKSRPACPNWSVYMIWMLH